VKPLLTALKTTPHIKAFAHITGGGFPENMPRVLPKALGIALDLSKIPVPPVFGWLAQAGGVPESEMLRTFNCGLGMIVLAARNAADEVAAALARAGETPIQVGEVCEAGAGPRVTTHGRLAL
jgi:phosphoribosylformylglycinamidine cyclo-ligase